jgi:hypothetical protein
MLRLRIFAAIVSVVTLAAMVLSLVLGAPIGVAIALIVAAACLAAIAPFDAPALRERNRVLFACLAYLVPVAAALAFARGVPGMNIVMVAIIVLLQVGIGLVCWAFATRKRRRMPRSRRYFDN